MLARYNLHVGNRYDDVNYEVALENPTGKQDSSAKGWFSGYSVDNPVIGVKPFSSTNYWSSTIGEYPSYIYNESSYLYEYVENYKTYLSNLGVTTKEVRLITIEELENLGCSRSGYSCSGAPTWIYSTTYWSGSADSSTTVWRVINSGGLFNSVYHSYDYGVRPVIVIPRDLI